MSRITYDETMSSSDALIWNIEKDPAAPLDRDECVVPAAAAGAPIDARDRRAPGRPDSPSAPTGCRGRPRPSWVETDQFDVADHYRYEDLGGTADRDDVLALAQSWVRVPFDRSRPLWQLGIFSGLADGRGALVLKLHHSIADGVGLMLMLAALADLEPNPAVRLALADVVPPTAPI